MTPGEQKFRRPERYDLQVDRALSASEGHFIAGFIEGEGHFGITEANGGQSFRCLMNLRLRDDDAELISWLRDRTGVGTLRRVAAQSTSMPQIEWRVDTQAGTRSLVELLSRFELRGRKRHEFEVWSAAVELWSSGLADRAELARGLQREITGLRRFRPPAEADVVAVPESVEALRGYLHGFLCAEGSFRLSRSHTTLTIHLRQDDRPLLQMFASALGHGHLLDQRAYPPAQPSSTWYVGRLGDAASMAKWLTPEELRGRKAAELEIWLQGVAERTEARAAGRAPRMGDLLAAFRTAREYRPGRPLAAPAVPDRCADTIALLRAWAHDQPGLLSCQSYEADRLAGWPNRDTITRRFGSWEAALGAAGLADRVASTSEVRHARAAGGAAGRKARADAQRERVLATLRYGVNIHGSLPTAMQFFRWRLVGAPATPSQATVYRLFPGGWPAVVEALRASSPGLMSTIPR
jgi:hypothetical protein